MKFEEVYNFLLSKKPTDTLIVFNKKSIHTDTELKTIFSKYGNVKATAQLTNLALVDFTASQPAETLVKLSSQRKLVIGSDNVQLLHSNKSAQYFLEDFSDNFSNKLQIVITNLKYKINVDVIKLLCLNYGKLTKIFVGNLVKSYGGLTVYIEFERYMDARLAQLALDSRSIYSSCCQMRARLSLLKEIFIEINTEYTWSLPESEVTAAKLEVMDDDSSSARSDSSVSRDSSPVANKKSSTTTRKRQWIDMTSSPPPKVVEPSCVFLCSNLPSQLTIDGLYNLFCLYGRISRARFASGRHSAATVQMDSMIAAQRCVHNFNGQRIFDQQIQLQLVTQSYIEKPRIVFVLPNRSPSYKDFFADKFYQAMNRNDDHDQSHQIEPNNTIHFYNAPNSFNEEVFRQLFHDESAPEPSSIVVFKRTEFMRHNRGLMEFVNLSDALTALTVINNKPIVTGSDKHVDYLRMVFSSRKFVCNEDVDRFRQQRWEEGRQLWLEREKLKKQRSAVDQEGKINNSQGTSNSRSCSTSESGNLDNDVPNKGAWLEESDDSDKENRQR